MDQFFKILQSVFWNRIVRTTQTRIRFRSSKQLKWIGVERELEQLK